MGSYHPSQEAIIRKLIRALPATLLGAVLVLAVACGGGGGGDSTREGGGGFSDLLVSDAGGALSRSAERFSQNVQSVKADFTFDISAAGMKIGGSGDFAFKAPDQMHMAMKFTGGEGTLFDFSQFGQFEVLVREGNFYMNTPVTGWVMASAADLGANTAEFQKLLTEHSPFDYDALIKKLDNTTNLGEEQIEGHTYDHLRVTADMKDLIEALSESLGSSDAGLPADGLSGPVSIDIWVDPQTLLPHKIFADVSIQPGSGEAQQALGSAPLGFEMVMNFREYNGAVEIPAAPADAKPLKDAFGNLSLGGAGDGS